MAGVATWNKATAPAGTEAWNYAAQVKRALETAGLGFGVANQAERDGLAALAPGGVLPVPTTVFRADVGVWETWDGTAWLRPAKTGSPVTTDANWSYNGGLIRNIGVDRTHVNMSLKMARVGAAFTLNTSYLVICPLVPLGWRPPVQAYTNVNLHTNGGVFKATLPAVISATGDLLLQTTSGSVTVDAPAGAAPAGDFFHISMGWHY